MTINELIRGLKKQEYKIPSFQRGFTWTYSKVVRLFDSIMANYPIYSFLFQRVTPSRVGQIGTEFYEFSQQVGENYLPKRVTDIRESFESVIDGQQRLYALYIGLDDDGYMYGKSINPGRKNSKSKNRSLYLNLMSEGNKDSETYNRSDEETTIYAFSFYDDEDIKEINRNDKNNDEYWFRVSKIKNFISRNRFDNTKLDEFVKHDEKLSKLNSRELKIVKDNLELLYERIYIDEDIIKFQELSPKLDSDEILDIFVRVNSGGTKLTFSDFLLSELSKSNAIDNCKGKIGKCQQDVKALINPHDYIDSMPLPFTINEENILRAILVCTAGEKSTDIKFSSITNRSKKRIETINDNLDHILNCVLNTFKILEILGFDGKVIPRNSFNVLIPIIFYLYNNIDENDLDAFIKQIKKDTYKDFREDLIWYIAATSLSGIFSTNNDTVLWNLLLIGRTNLREDIKTSHAFVPTKVIKETLKNGNSLNLDNALVEWIQTKYSKITKRGLEKIVDEATFKSKNTRLLLLLLYPNKGTGFVDKDHLHPKKLFIKNQRGSVRKKLMNQGLSEEDIDRYDSIMNLQPCYKYDNRGQKNDKSLKEWYKDNNLCKEDLLLYKIPKKWENNVDGLLEIENFNDFIQSRRKNILKILENKLIIKE